LQNEIISARNNRMVKLSSGKKSSQPPPALEHTGHAALEHTGHAALEQNGHAALEQNGHAALEQNGHAALKHNGHAQTLLETWWSFGQIMRHRIIPLVIDDFNLDLKDFFALTVIFEGINYPKLICERLATNPSDVSRILERLEQLGLVTRTLDTDDSRRIQVRLTTDGLATVEKMRRGVAVHISQALEHLPPEELEHFSRSLTLLTHNLKAQFDQ
jgi:DNA-binding MarR family transcriptional regulator